MVVTRRLLALGLAAACLALAACTPGVLAPDDADAEERDGTPAPPASPPASAGEAVAEVALGPYEGDPRLAGIAASWPEQVARAEARVRTTTGLALPAGTRPRVVLAPLGDERRGWAVDSEVVDGVRRPRVRVNAEVLAPGLADPARLLAQGLAAAALEDAASHRGVRPPWLVTLAATSAAGDADERLLGLARRAMEDGPGAIRVDPAVGSAHEATALAALLVLQTQGTPGALRRFLVFTAEGDDPDVLLARTLQDPFGQWVGTGRALLEERLAGVDVGPWRMLARAEAALEQMGRAGLEAALPDEVPWAVAHEVRVLRARAAADQGDWARVEELLDGLDVDAWRRLDDPAEALLLRLRARLDGGGDPAVVGRLAGRWRRDFPRAWARHGTDPDLQRALGAVGVGEGLAGQPLDVVERRLAALLDDHRPGAARRLLATLGPRAGAPELAVVARRIARAEESPPAETVEVLRRRVAAWRARPGPSTRDAVVDGGGAAALALAEVLPAAPGEARRATVELMAAAAEAGKVVEALGPTWSSCAACVEGDLDTLLADIPYAALVIWTRPWLDGVLAEAEAEALFARLRLGIDQAFWRSHPALLADLRSGDYTRRQAAFDALVEADQATPEVVARALADDAALLRRSGAFEAGRGDHRALVRHALADEAWVVREAALRGLAAGPAGEAIPFFLRRARHDPAPQVRRAATQALVATAAQDARTIDVLVDALVRDDAAVRDLAASALRDRREARVVAALARAMDTELAAPPAEPAVLARLFLAFERATGAQTGYHPGLDLASTRTLVARVHATARRLAATEGGE